MPFWLVGESTHFRTYFSGWIGMFTGGTIGLLPQGHLQLIKKGGGGEQKKDETPGWVSRKPNPTEHLPLAQARRAAPLGRARLCGYWIAPWRMLCAPTRWSMLWCWTPAAPPGASGGWLSSGVDCFFFASFFFFDWSRRFSLLLELGFLRRLLFGAYPF